MMWNVFFYANRNSSYWVMWFSLPSVLSVMTLLQCALQVIFLAMMVVDGSDISKYGFDIPRREPGLVAGISEKQNVERVASNLASIRRYVLTPDIFDILRNQSAGAGGEIQLADAINS
jgi:UTP-glucose-1-phosphate uridylyltransferase